MNPPTRILEVLRLRMMNRKPKEIAFLLGMSLPNVDYYNSRIRIIARASSDSWLGIRSSGVCWSGVCWRLRHEHSSLPEVHYTPGEDGNALLVRGGAVHAERHTAAV